MAQLGPILASSSTQKCGFCVGGVALFSFSAICSLRFPSCLQDDPKRAKEVPKCPQDGPKRAQDDPKMHPRGSQDAPKAAPRRLQDASKNDLMLTSSRISAKTSPRGSRDPPKKPPEPPGTPPEGALEAPGTPPEAPKTPPRGFHGLSKSKQTSISVSMLLSLSTSFLTLQQIERTVTKPPEASGMRYYA